MNKTAFCFRETVATFILDYLVDYQPRKTTYSRLNKQLKVATEEHGWLEILQGKRYFIGLHLALARRRRQLGLYCTLNPHTSPKSPFCTTLHFTSISFTHRKRQRKTKHRIFVSTRLVFFRTIIFRREMQRKLSLLRELSPRNDTNDLRVALQTTAHGTITEELCQNMEHSLRIKSTRQQ
jgi:hypothetical protein